MVGAASQVLSKDRLLEIYKLTIATGVVWGSYKGLCDWWGSKVHPIEFEDNYVMDTIGPIINTARGFTIFAMRIGGSALLTGITVATIPVTGPAALLFGKKRKEITGTADTTTNTD